MTKEKPKRKMTFSSTSKLREEPTWTGKIIVLGHIKEDSNFKKGDRGKLVKWLPKIIEDRVKNYTVYVPEIHLENGYIIKDNVCLWKKDEEIPNKDGVK